MCAEHDSDCVQAEKRGGLAPAVGEDADMEPGATAETVQQAAAQAQAAFHLGKRDRTAEASTSAAVGKPCCLPHHTRIDSDALATCSGCKGGPGWISWHACTIAALTCSASQVSRAARTSSCCADPSRKAFFKDFMHVVREADVILEVLDARDPEGTRCLDVERFIRRSGGDKKIVLVLNKIGAPLRASPNS